MLRTLGLILLLAAPAQAQIELVRPADFRYHVAVGEDTVSTRSLEYKAIQDGIQYKQIFPNSTVTIHPSGIEVRGQFVGAPDTVFIQSSTLLQNVEWTHISNPDSLYFYVAAQAESEYPLHFQWYCSGEIVRDVGKMTTRSDTLQTACTDLKFSVTATRQIDQFTFESASYREEIVLPTFFDDTIFTDFTDFDPAEWRVIWGNLDYGIIDEALHITLPERNIARLMWDRIPEHTNIRYRVIEEFHGSHSTGVHIGGRHSLADREHSVESYLNSNGIGVSVFDGGWSNPLNFPFDFADGDLIEYTVTVIDEVMTIEIGSQVYSAQVPVFPGFFAIGSTGAGLYIIHEIEIEIL